MTIKLPDSLRWNGREIPVEGAMERALNADKTPEPETEQEQQNSNAPNLNGYVWVPSIKLYVAKERSLLGLTWNKTQEELKKQGLFMPTPYHFREFLKYLRDSKKPEEQKIFNEIVEVREPWRAKWLNARFEERKGLYMVSENALANGMYGTIEQKLDDFLDKDKTPGISLDDWLDSNAQHGLPVKKTKSGKLYYWAPIPGYVAGFVAYSGRANLGCSWRPDYSYSSLGVFACAEGAVAKNGRR